MSLISKEHLNLVLQSIKKLLSNINTNINYLLSQISQKLGKEDHYTDEEMLELLSESVNLSPLTENGNYLVEGDSYLIL